MPRLAIIALCSAVVAVVAMAVYMVMPGDGADAQAAASATPARAGQGMDAQSLAASAAAGQAGGAGSTGAGPFSPEGQRQRAAQLVLWQGRFERAEQTYNHYRDATRYPHESRPLAEHPDQVRPFDAIAEDNKLRGANGEPVKGVKLRTTQERVFASGADTIKLTVQAVDDTGAALVLRISSASAQSVPEGKTLSQVIQTNINFVDDGQGADSAAGDGTYSTRLAPKDQGFATHAGTVRVLVKLSAGGQDGVAHFDVIYNPDVPAKWIGVREAIEAGSLNFYFKVQVAQPGRYVASARVDDANGKPFALLQFNDEVTTGEREFKMHVFGALVHDKRPAFPLRVRDVEGFLLIENRFPDRALMARQNGVVHTTGRYSVDNFSPKEWTSEERERYLAEYANDAEVARQQLARLQR